ncbi:hypothetical protein FOCC_FOCC009329 [Frankliniella occidentalis]|nr:hypothetical protein FOCC_FOCC009329 [Frankliniella occidentalis]
MLHHWPHHWPHHWAHHWSRCVSARGAGRGASMDLAPAQRGHCCGCGNLHTTATKPNLATHRKPATPDQAMGMGSGGSRWVGSRSHNAKMRILVCCVMIAIGVLPMPPLKIMTTTEEPYESGDEGSDFGSDILNTLLEVVGTLLSFFSDPPGAIQKMVDQAKQLMGGARSLMATVRAQRQAGAPIPDGVGGMVEQVKKLVDVAIELAALGPAGARQARIMLTEAQRILETARGIMETTGRITNTARNVAQSIARPWTG